MEKQSVLTEDRQGYLLIRVNGRFGAASVGEVTRAIERAQAAGQNNFAFDLANTSALDSPALGLLSTLQKQLIPSGVRLSLIAPKQNVTKLLDSSGLLKVVKVYDTLATMESEQIKGLEVTEKGFYVLLSIPQQFNIGVVRPLRDSIETSLNRGYTHYVFDFAETKMVSSVGFGVLLNLQNMLQSKSGGVHLVNMSSDVRAAMNTANVLRVIPEYSSIDEIDRKLI